MTCDSYGISNTSFATQYSQQIMFKGAQQSFKFKDYYSVFDINFTEPDVFLTKNTSMYECISKR